MVGAGPFGIFTLACYPHQTVDPERPDRSKEVDGEVKRTECAIGPRALVGPAP
jgi:hypothetical protein